MEEANETRCQGTADNVKTTNVVGREAARQTILPFANRPIREKEDVNYREMGIPTPKNELGRRVMKEYHFRTCDGQPIATCRHCGVEYIVNIIRLRTHFTRDHDPRGKQQVGLPKRGSQKHVMVCASVPYSMWSMALNVMGLPFRTLQHPVLKEAFHFSAKLSRYKLPSITALRTKLLDKTYANVKRTAEQNIWDGSNMTKDAKWVSGHILNAINKVDPKNVLQFIADNASVNILTGKFVRAEYPDIIFGGCVAHSIDLLFEDMENGAMLLKPGVTRFTTNIIMLDRMYYLQHCLKKMVVSEQWTTWVPDLHWPSNTKFKADNIKQAILDETFWNKTQDLLLLVEPIFRLLRQVDAYKDFMGRIFWESWETQESIKHLWKHKGLKSNLLTKVRCDEVFLLFRHRWDKWHNMIHSMAMLLHPSYLFYLELHEVYEWNYIYTDFQQYIKLYGEGIMGYDPKGDQHKEWMEKCNEELESIAYQNANDWPLLTKEKALSERTK
ncbi:hypothetical protein R1flu_012951 [Riccia fluitans]|uniref:DUF659 domain-containing protein n=1 Tax=Riccia fluitans TaxID=41844 RepID=A0ABD1ZEJ3_9MARC